MECGENVYLFTLSRFAVAFDVQYKTLIAGGEEPPPLRDNRFEVNIKLSIPFEEFDQSRQLVVFIDLLKKLLGGDMEPGQPKPGSIIIPVKLTEEQLQKLIEIIPDFNKHVNDLRIRAKISYRIWA